MLSELSFSDRWSRGTKLWERDWIVPGNLLSSPSTLCRHIGLLFGERMNTLFPSMDSKLSGLTRPHVIGFVADLYFFHSGEQIYFFAGFAVEFARYLWTVAVLGKEKLRIRKYPDTCGRPIKDSGHSGTPKLGLT